MLFASAIQEALTEPHRSAVLVRRHIRKRPLADKRAAIEAGLRAALAGGKRS